MLLIHHFYISFWSLSNFNIFWILYSTSVLFEHNSAVPSQIVFRTSTEAPPSHKLIRNTHTSRGRLCCLPITSCSSTPTKQCQLTNICSFEGRYCFVAFIVPQQFCWKLLNTRVWWKSVFSPNIITSVFQRVMRRRNRPRQVIYASVSIKRFFCVLFIYMTMKPPTVVWAIIIENNFDKMNSL